MPVTAPDAIARGRAALREAKWSAAQSDFELALRSGDDGDALEGLSEALWWLDEVEASIRERERAYAWFREHRDLRRAARIAVWIAREHLASVGDYAVASGWLARAERLAAEAGPCVEAAWIELMHARSASDPAVTKLHADRAATIARTFGDIDLEMWALSEGGRAMVSCGDVAGGMRDLDEAVAAATSGEMKELNAIADTCCNMITACERAYDYQRLRQWARVVDEFCRRNHCMPLMSFCQIVSGGSRIETGDWANAEKELSTASRNIKGHPPMRIHAIARLALLRVRQGRIEDARRLLRGNETHSAAVQPMAALHLATGDAATAASLLEPVVEKKTAGDVRAVPFLDLLIEACARAGRIDDARRHLASLRGLADRTKIPVIEASALRAAARIESDDDALQRAAEIFTDAGLPFDAGVTRLERAEALVEQQPELAELEAAAALAAFDDLGASLLADRSAQLLRTLGVRARRAPRIEGVLTQREQQVFRLLASGLSNPAIGERLHISAKTVEHHVSRILSKLGVRNRVEAAALLPTPSA
jgi:ATP/maltotriose-dependent transcriptional regulator MalT